MAFTRRIFTVASTERIFILAYAERIFILAFTQRESSLWHLQRESVLWPSRTVAGVQHMYTSSLAQGPAGPCMHQSFLCFLQLFCIWVRFCWPTPGGAQTVPNAKHMQNNMQYTRHIRNTCNRIRKSMHTKPEVRQTHTHKTHANRMRSTRIIQTTYKTNANHVQNKYGPHDRIEAYNTCALRHSRDLDRAGLAQGRRGPCRDRA
jgi:hypothetical protein